MDLNFRMNIYIYIDTTTTMPQSLKFVVGYGSYQLGLATIWKYASKFQVITLFLCKLLFFCIEFPYNTFLGHKITHCQKVLCVFMNFRTTFYDLFVHHLQNFLVDIKGLDWHFCLCLHLKEELEETFQSLRCVKV